jgi:ABC-type Mn2+/Zn2+ transport system ATPase subunit
MRGDVEEARVLFRDYAIRLDHVSSVYEGERRAAIRDITLTIDRGELIYIVGPNAAGKTTLLEIINGLLTPVEGLVQVLGLDVGREGRRVRCRVGYVPQDFLVDPGEPYTALDVVLMGMYGMMGILRRPGRKDRDRCIEVMALLGVDELADRSMGKLSGGQQQKVIIARALAKDPEILLLDEAFSNLDKDSRRRIPELIDRLHRDRGITTLIVTHDLSHPLDSCERMIAMDQGRIVADGEPREVLSILEDSTSYRQVEMVG